nr:uncharacterized protein LOC104266258 isoform X1 [Ciona intestinalis]|eukprot:XP_018669649.1 uncharacterized protein LOC104266258 isoform X1 [Ciona intestinalis]
MLLKLILFLACYVSFVTAQAVPSVYSPVALFDCFNPNSLELIRINTMCGTLLSPCYPDNYTVEVDAGKKLWDIQYIPPTGRTVAGYRLNFNDFVTNDFGGDGGIIYIGQTISVDSSTNVAEAARDISISGDGRTAPGFLIQRTGVAATNGLIGHVLDLDYPRWYTNFYSSLQPARRGFNITYCGELNLCDAAANYCKNGGTCSRASFGVYSCACTASFMGPTCEIDVDECLTNPCHSLATCTNTVGTFICTCNAGYTGDGLAAGTCANINECTLPSHNCHANAACTDTIGSFTCACNTGYTGNGVTCTDVDECTVGTHTCHAQATCTNTVGSFTCACNTGFTGNGLTCTNINECTLPSHNCHANAACTDTIGSFTCACNTGYTGNGVTCTDVDECTVGTHTCHAQATCTNTVGSFTCACNTGFTGDGFTCTNINECTTGAHNCDVNADCTDTPGSFTCQCKTGYTGNGNSCVDIDECTLGTDNCHASATCTNTVGSYTCMCNAGFTGDGFTCIDIDECVLGLHNCNTSLNDQVCLNTMGSFNCLCNSPEYRGTPPSCLGYYCPGNVSLPATCLIPGFIEWPLFHDGSKIFNNNEEVTWFVNMTGQVNKTAIRFIFQEISVAHTQDYIIFSTSPDINDLSAFLAVITGTKTNILNQLTAASSTNPVGFDVATSTYIIPRTEVYIHFHSDREIVSTGFKIRYDPDTDDCVTSSVNCKNNGTCSDRVFDYMCENCPGYTGRDCDMDEDECSNSTLNNCHANSTCTNLNGTFSCACNAPSFTGNGTFCQPHLNVTNLVVSSPPGGTSLNITFDTTAPWGTDPNYLNNYNILVFKVGNTTPTNMTTANVNLPAFQSTVVSGLLPATSYYVQITAGARGPLFPTAVFEINVANITYQTADTVPLAPSNLNVTSSDQDTVRIEWTRPNETSIGKTIEYTVEAQRSVQDCITFGVPALGFQVDCALPKDFTVSASAVMSNTYVLTGLVPYRTYNIRIRAKTSAGSGPWSNNATAFTGIECPGFRRPVPASQPSCTFQEASIRSENFPRQYPPWNDTFYSVDFRGQGAVQIVFDFFATEPNQDYLDIIFGTINFAPQIPNSRIRNSFTGDITGSQSPIVFTMAETGGILTLRFHADLFNPTGNGSFPGFQVHYETNSTRCSPNPCINGGTCTDIPFDFQCACPTIWGGKVCNLQLVSIDVQCSSTSPTSFTVNWNVTSAWQNDATVIAGYNVTYSGAVTDSMRKALGDSSATVSGFTGYQPYTVTVTILAVSPATVPTSNTCSGNTAQQTPDAPTSVVATATSSSTIDVTWVAPVVTRGVVSSYTVTYTQTENGVSMSKVVFVPATTSNYIFPPSIQNIQCLCFSHHSWREWTNWNCSCHCQNFRSCSWSSFWLNTDTYCSYNCCCIHCSYQHWCNEL